MNPICKKTLVIGIILLFIGVSVSSAISVDNKPIVSLDESEECIECRELSNAELVKVKQLINRVEVYSKLLMVLSNYNPEIKDECEEISDKISTLDGLLVRLKPDSPLNNNFTICIILYMIVWVIVQIMLIFDKIATESDGLIEVIADSIKNFLGLPLFLFMLTYHYFDCPWDLYS
jgi:hypothetical protein